MGLRELSCSAGGSDVGRGFLQDGWGRLDFADDLFRLGDGVEIASVGAGELEAVEQAAGVLEIYLVGGEGVDDLRDRDLDGDAIFEGAEVEDSSLALKVGAGHDGRSVDAVRVMQVAVEVAEDGGFEGDGLALKAVGTNVAAEFDLHEVLLHPLVLSTSGCVIYR